MTSPQFVHLRLHSEYSIVDGLVRIDDVVKAAAKDEQPALAITDLANLFGMVKFYKAARGKGVKPIVGCDVWITNRRRPRKALRLLLLVKNTTGYLQLCELLSQRLAHQPVPRAAPNCAPSGWREVRSGARRPDRAVGRAFRRHRLRARHAAIRRGRALRRALGGGLPGPFLHRDPARRPAQPGSSRCASRWRWRPAAACRWWRRTRCSSCRPRTFVAHEARTCIAEGEIMANARRVRRFNEQQCVQDRRPRWPRCSPTCRARWPTAVEIAQPLQPRAGTGQAAAARLPDAGRHDDRRIPGGRIARRAWSSACCTCTPTRRCARRSGRATRSA